MKNKITNALLISFTGFAAFSYITNYFNKSAININILFSSVVITATIALLILCSFLFLKILKPKEKTVKFPFFLLLNYLFLIVIASSSGFIYKNLSGLKFWQYEVNIIYKISILFIFYLLFFLLVYSIGIKTLNKLLPNVKINHPEKHIFAFGVGFIPFIFGLFLFLILGVFYTWVVSVFIITLMLWSAPEIKNTIINLWHFQFKIRTQKNIDLLRIFVIVVVFLILSLGFVFITKPTPITTDDLSTYFNGPNIFVNHQSYQVLEQHIRANRGKNTEMIYSGIMTLFDTSFIVHFQFFSFILLLAGIYFFVKNFWQESYALIAVLTVLTIPWNRFYFGTCKVEFFLAFYCLLLLYLAFLYVYKKNLNSSGYLYLFGILAGVALGIKYTAIFVVLPLAIFIFLTKSKRGSNKTLFKNLCGAGLLGLLFFSPWLIKNEVYFDNPTHPETTIFGESDYSTYNQLAAKPEWRKVRSQEINELRHAVSPKNKYNIGEIVHTLWDQSVGNKIDVGAWINFGFIPALILPFYIVYRKEKKKFYLILLALAQFILWYIVSGARPWYNFFGIITLYITLSFLVVDYKKFGYFYITVATIIFFCFFYYLTPNVDYLIGKTTKEQYKQKTIAHYDLAQYINNHDWNKKNKILMAGFFPTAFIKDNHKITRTDAYYFRIGSHIHQGDQEFLRALKEASIGYIVKSQNSPINDQWIENQGFADKKEYLNQYNKSVPSIYEDEMELNSFLDKHGSLQHQTNGYYLYKIKNHEQR